MNSPVLAFADYTKDFLLETDALKEGLGAFLSQKQEDGWFHPVAYGSWVLTTHEKNYHLMKLEFLALKWAVKEHFKEYLLYQPFLVKTNNNPLMYIMSDPNLDATGHRWVSVLTKYDFQLGISEGTRQYYSRCLELGLPPISNLRQCRPFWMEQLWLHLKEWKKKTQL